MSKRTIPAELLATMKRDRDLIAQELPDLMQRHDRMVEAAAEDTLCGHLRQVIHKSHKSLDSIAASVGITTEMLCDFLEGERSLRGDVLDRLAKAIDATVSVSLPE